MISITPDRRFQRTGIFTLLKNINKDGEFSNDKNAWNEVFEAVLKGESYIGTTYDVNFKDEDDTD